MPAAEIREYPYEANITLYEGDSYGVSFVLKGDWHTSRTARLMARTSVSAGSATVTLTNGDGITTARYATLYMEIVSSGPEGQVVKYHDTTGTGYINLGECTIITINPDSTDRATIRSAGVLVYDLESYVTSPGTSNRTLLRGTLTVAQDISR